MFRKVMIMVVKAINEINTSFIETERAMAISLSLRIVLKYSFVL